MKNIIDVMVNEMRVHHFALLEALTTIETLPTAKDNRQHPTKNIWFIHFIINILFTQQAVTPQLHWLCGPKKSSRTLLLFVSKRMEMRVCVCLPILIRLLYFVD